MIPQITNPREIKGKEIAGIESQIRRIDEGSYLVNSQSGNGIYEVLSTELGWICSCPDNIYRNVKCKHVWAVEFSLVLRKQVNQNIIEPFSVSNCLFCKSSNIKKFGIRKNKSGDIQRFVCEDCKRTFSVNVGFERMKHNPQAITTALQLYFSGESLRNTQRSLRLLGVQVSHMTIYNWIEKYVQLMQKYLDKITPKVSNTWRADEIYLKVKGDLKYLFALMDDETRFWIAQEVADTKHNHDVRSLFQLGRKVAGKKPITLITDGLMTYNVAYRREYESYYKPKTEHIRHISMKGDKNNNKMERLNGEIRDREKVMRGLKKKNTPILKGYQIFHNYIRPHEALNGQTPASRADIQINGENKWMTIIQNANREVDKNIQS